MKPPQRQRAAPARYLGAVSGPAAWSIREKRRLLRLLQARRGQPEPNAAELARGLPGRSEDEIRDFLRQLKGRVAREAIQRLHPGGPLGRRRQTPAPIEVWTDLAEKITGPLEEPLTAAFSQGDFTVDFEKIYKYLASSSRSGLGPELSPAESSVVLDLLLSLPEELSRLPCTALAEHMTGAYLRLTAPQPSLAAGGLGPETEDGDADSRGHEEPGQATPQASESAGPSEPRSAWQAAGVCPLNPFLVPLELLGQAVTPAK
ncbi:snRNA-activating protein complex subunit 2 isoform 3-T3 [Dugong dugon]